MTLASAINFVSEHYPFILGVAAVLAVVYIALNFTDSTSVSSSSSTSSQALLQPGDPASISAPLISVNPQIYLKQSSLSPAIKVESDLIHKHLADGFLVRPCVPINSVLDGIESPHLRLPYVVYDPATEDVLVLILPPELTEADAIRVRSSVPKRIAIFYKGVTV